jgi:hypothetical protein
MQWLFFVMGTPVARGSERAAGESPTVVRRILGCAMFVIGGSGALWYRNTVRRVSGA